MTLFKSADRAVEVLDAMDDCVVMKNATMIIKRTLARAKEYSNSGEGAGAGNVTVSRTPDLTAKQTTNIFSEGGEGFNDSVLQFDMEGIDEGQALFWTEWGNSFGLLGA